VSAQVGRDAIAGSVADCLDVQREVRAIAVRQPWAIALALKMKQYETRAWPTDYRGWLLIHACQRQLTREEEGLFVRYCPAFRSESLNPRYARGKIIALAELADCWQMDESLIAVQSEQELALGDWKPGFFAFKLANVWQCRLGYRYQPEDESF
jgi:hypothetical protein